METTLHSWHRSRGARMTAFAGYDMPLYYPMGAVEEHRTTRRSAGLFDLGHMARLRVGGLEAASWLEGIVSAEIGSLAPGMGRYTLLLAEDGGILDDAFVYALPGGDYLLVGNGVNREVWRHEAGRAPAGVRVEDWEESWTLLALQGSRSLDLLAACGRELPPRRNAMVAWTRKGASPIWCSRTGYTGEEGVELLVKTSAALELWEGLLARAAAEGIEALPVGLAARDSLRFEAGMPLYGHEIDQNTRPAEAGLAWACKHTAPFRGSTALAEPLTRPRGRLTALRVQGGIARQGTTVCTADGSVVGRVVSGMYCPSLDLAGAHAYLDPGLNPDSPLFVDLRGMLRPCFPTSRPLYPPVYRRKTQEV